ncbi:hypothetical protein K458DRAFT_167074 [Lentithecium fluviatile CBS 122367]|uniref:Uncharacterized protein n=1 Tax=Lentithecium fluviatile CBS 122367 TaxID=1168545 RepID=A0A6G1IFZ0_9PLEO|nr:hypothetical protein K458DRAFT_167074 [Lentithecium fluviatile CBS 122367]
MQHVTDTFSDTSTACTINHVYPHLQPAYHPRNAARTQPPLPKTNSEASPPPALATTDRTRSPPDLSRHTTLRATHTALALRPHAPLPSPSAPPAATTTTPTPSTKTEKRKAENSLTPPKPAVRRQASAVPLRAPIPCLHTPRATLRPVPALSASADRRCLPAQALPHPA